MGTRIAARTDGPLPKTMLSRGPRRPPTPKAVLDVDEQLGATAAGAQLDDCVLHGALAALALGLELDRRLGDVGRLDLDGARGRADDERDGALDGEGLSPHRRHPRVPLGLRTRMDGSCFGGLRSPISLT